MVDEHVIEFRSGAFLQSLEADHGGPRATAMRFPSKRVAETFMDDHWWIYLNGGVAVPADDGIQ